MFGLGLDASLIEAAKKLKENDPYNPSGAGPARLPAQPSAGGKMNIADDKKHGKGCSCNECSMTPGYDKTTRTYESVEEETEKSFDATKDARMSINQLKSVLHNTTELLAMIKPDDLLPEWVETKITLAEDYMVTCSNFLRSDRTK